MNYSTKLILTSLAFACVYSLATFTGFFNNKEIVDYPAVIIGTNSFNRGERIKFEENKVFSIGNKSFTAEKNTELILLDTRPENIKLNLLVGRLQGQNATIQLRSHLAKMNGDFEIIHLSWVEMADINTQSDWTLNEEVKEPGIYKLHTGSGAITLEENPDQGLE